MSKIVNIAEKQIIDSVTAALKQNMADGTFIEAEIPAFKTEIPADRNNGDYSANAAFMLSKALRMPPRKIAEEIQNKIDLNDTYFEKCEIAGPGFINFFLKNEFYADVLSDIDALGDNYGKSDFGKGKKINVEFVSANPTGPMHMGNARGGALGDCLAAVMDRAGYKVTREFYVKDTFEWFCEHYGADKTSTVELLKSYFRDRHKKTNFNYNKFLGRKLNDIVGVEPDPDFRKYDR